MKSSRSRERTLADSVSECKSQNCQIWQSLRLERPPLLERGEAEVAQFEWRAFELDADFAGRGERTDDIVFADGGEFGGSGRLRDELPRGEVFAVEQVDGFFRRLGADEGGEEREGEEQVFHGTEVGYHVFHLLWVAAFFSKKCPRQESNLNLEFRKPLFYPLNYGGIGAGQGEQ
jgi:hypothetical protein